MVEFAHLLLAFTTGIALIGALVPFLQIAFLGLEELKRKHVCSPHLAIVCYCLVIFPSQAGLAALLIGATAGPEYLLPLEKSRSLASGETMFWMATYSASYFPRLVMQ